MRSRFTRRAFASGVVTAIGCYTFGNPAGALPRAPESLAGAATLPQPFVTAAALQWGPSLGGGEPMESVLTQQLAGLSEQIRPLDLVVIGRPDDHAGAFSDDCVRMIGRFSDRSGCYAIAPAVGTTTFLVFGADFRSGPASFKAGVTLSTRFGRIAINNRLRRDADEPYRAGVDIDVVYTTAGHGRWQPPESAARGAAYSIVVTSPLAGEAQRSKPGTAFYSPQGDAMTEAGCGWNQMVLGNLYLAGL